MWEPEYNYNSSDSNHEGKKLWAFQKCYVNDYIAHEEGRWRKSKLYKEIYIHFKFQKFLFIPNIKIFQSLNLYNLWQFKSTLSHYYDQPNEFHFITDHSKYRDLSTDIEECEALQWDIDKRIDKLSRYLTFTFESSFGCWSPYILTYTNLDRSTLPLAIKHLQSILLAFMIWSYRSSDRNDMDELMTEISKQYKDKLPHKSFQTYYTDSLFYLQPKSPIIMLRINLKLTLVDTKHSLNKILPIRNIDQFKAVLRSYNSDTLQDFIPLKNSSKYKDIDPNITYRNTLQVRIDKILKWLKWSFYCYAKEDEYNPLTLHLSYNHWIKKSLVFLVKYLELVTLTFKTWNDNKSNKHVVDLYLLRIKDELLSLLKNESFECSWNYYIHYWLQYLEKPNSNTLHLNLHIILKEYQRTITKTLQLQEPVELITLLDYHKYLPNGYFPSSKSFDTSLSKLLYIFEQDENDESNLNLYYYPLSNELNTSLIIKHLKGMISFFKTFNQKVNDINISPTDIKTFSQYLSSITPEFNSINTHNPTNNKNTQLSISTFTNLTHNPTKNNQLSISTPTNLSIPTFNPSLTKPSSKTSTTSTTSLPSKPFWYLYNPTDPNTVLPSPLTLHLRFLPFDNLTFNDTIHLQDTSRFLSILNHYSLIPNTFSHLDSNDFKISNKIKIQKDIDTTLLDLSDRILFYSEKTSNDPILYLTYSNLKLRDIPSTLLHLELMVKVFGIWSYDNYGTKVLNDFVNKARRMIIPKISHDSILHDDNGDKGTIITTLPTDRDHPTVLGPLVPMDTSGPTDVSPNDGRLGGASVDFPDLRSYDTGDISMMEDVD